MIFLGIVQVSKGRKSLYYTKASNIFHAHFNKKNDKYIQSHECEWLRPEHAFIANTCMCFRSFYFYLFIMGIKLKKINFISIQISWNGAHCCSCSANKWPQLHQIVCEPRMQITIIICTQTRYSTSILWCMRDSENGK